MRNERFTKQEAQNAKTKNIIEISLDFSTMTRVFAKQSTTKILERLQKLFAQIDGIRTQTEYDRLHRDFCDWFITNICTAERRCRDGRIKASCECSYGHAAKVLDVAAKVYIYYCGQPSPDTAQRVVPMLHAALDTDMMRHLCSKAPDTLYGVDRAEYERLQALVFLKIGESGIHPVQYDDVMWRRLQRSRPSP